MAGNQHGFIYHSESCIEGLYNAVLLRLVQCLDQYNLSDANVLYVQISFLLLDKMSFSDLVISKDKLVNVSSREKRDSVNLISLPTSVDEEYLGKPLPTVLGADGLVKKVHLTVNKVIVNLMDLIIEKTTFIRKGHKDIITEFDHTWNFYYIKSTTDFILATNTLEGNIVDMLKYSTSGVLILKISDRLDGNTLIRSKGSDKMYIENKQVIKTSKSIVFNGMDKYKFNKVSLMSNPNIGVIDLETYLSQSGSIKVYALGFITNLSDNPTRYYIDHINYDSSIIVIQWLDELLRSKYSDIIFYCHNFTGYDVVFIIKVLNHFNDIEPHNKYKLVPVLRDNQIIQLTIKKR